MIVKSFTLGQLRLRVTDIYYIYLAPSCGYIGYGVVWDLQLKI